MRLGRVAGVRDSFNLVTVMLLGKFVCVDSEICPKGKFEWKNCKLRILRNSESDPLLDCLSRGLHALSSSGFGFRVYPCSFFPTQDMKVAQEVFQSEWQR